jgi:hypothetical protein
LPPGLLDQRPSRSPTPEKQILDSDSDDEYGPSIPIPGAASAAVNSAPGAPNFEETDEEEAKKPARAEWMTLPPTSGSSSLNFDPSRHRARGFNTKPVGIGGRGESKDGLSAQWTETPEEKKKRLANEVLGIASTGGASASTSDRKRKLKAAEDARTADRLSSKRRTEESLLDSHVKKQRKEGEDVEEDDPSKRAFDWEKDMNAGFGRMGGKDRKDMVKKATTEFGGRFSGGGYL